MGQADRGGGDDLNGYKVPTGGSIWTFALMREEDAYGVTLRTIDWRRDIVPGAGRDAGGVPGGRRRTCRREPFGVLNPG
jgi:hypothetical protein